MPMLLLLHFCACCPVSMLHSCLCWLVVHVSLVVFLPMSAWCPCCPCCPSCLVAHVALVALLPLSPCCPCCPCCCLKIRDVCIDFEQISRSRTLSLFTLKTSNLVKWPISTWSFMWWCQFIDCLKFETRPSSLLNFGTAYKLIKIHSKYTKAKKRLWLASCDWFWFTFGLDQQMARFFSSQSCRVIVLVYFRIGSINGAIFFKPIVACNNANPIKFWHLSENYSRTHSTLSAVYNQNCSNVWSRDRNYANQSVKALSAMAF